MASMKDLLGDTPFQPALAFAPPPSIEGTDIPPEVFTLFEKFTWEAINAGMTRFSSDAICARIRWFCTVEKQLGDSFKVNDHYTAILSRWFMKKYPQHEGFFETRKRRGQS